MRIKYHFANPKGTVSNWYNPEGTMNIAFPRSDGLTSTCQYPLAGYAVETHFI